jgi:hypothetical protein
VAAAERRLGGHLISPVEGERENGPAHAATAANG